MKFIVERNILRDALPFVIGRTKGIRANIPILTHLLIESADRKIVITGNDLDSCSQVEVPAEIEKPGRIAMPADRLHRLVMGLADGSQISIEADPKAAKLKCGRSSYQFALLPPEEFPEIFKPAEPVTIHLTAAQIVRLFKTPSPFVEPGVSRPHLNGVYLHKRGKVLAACATDGHRLMRTLTDAECPDFSAVIVPEGSCDEIVRLVDDEECDIEIAQNLLSVTASGRRFVTKLIDGIFPNYERVIPQANAPFMTVTSSEIDAALKRLVAAIDSEAKSPGAVKLAWDDDAANFTVLKQSAGNDGREQIDCDCPGRPAGEIGGNLDYLRSLIDGLGGTRTRFFINGPGDPIRMENPDDDGIVAVLMPMRA